MNILYIEDNINDSQLVNRYVNTTGHQLTIAASLEDAEDMLDRADLILLDIMIGNQRLGLEYIKHIRSTGINCPVMAVTALTLPRQVEEYRELGFDDVIEKPFEITRLADVITTYAT